MVDVHVRQDDRLDIPLGDADSRQLHSDLLLAVDVKPHREAEIRMPAGKPH
jgi:hypothetical protein